MARKAKTTIVFKVSMAIPTGATVTEAQAYVKDAIMSHAGGIVDGPMKELDREKIRVALDSRHTYY